MREREKRAQKGCQMFTEIRDMYEVFRCLRVCRIFAVARKECELIETESKCEKVKEIAKKCQKVREICAI